MINHIQKGHIITESQKKLLLNSSPTSSEMECLGNGTIILTKNF